MAESKVPKLLADQHETPEDVATLYSWANLHGAKYRDFSASRAEAREEARLRVEKVQAEERRILEAEAERRAQEEAQIAARQAAEAAEAAREAEADRLAEIARQAEAERQAVLAAQEAQRQSAWQRARQPVADEDLESGYAPSFGSGAAPSHTSNPMPDSSARASVPSPGGSYPDGRGGSAEQARTGRRRQIPGPAQYAAQFAHENPALNSPPHGQPNFAPASTQDQFVSNAYSELAENYPAGNFFAQPAWQQPEYREAREQSSRPAWLSAEPSIAVPRQPVGNQSGDPNSNLNSGSGWGFAAPASPGSFQPYGSPQPGQNAVPAQGQSSWQMTDLPQNPGPNPASNSGSVDDTLQGSRDRVTNRWFALKSVFDRQTAMAEQVPVQPPARVPVLAVFSLAGGVGKTSLVASLGRALSTRGERVLLVDTASYGLLPFFFGARDQRPGMLRTFTPPGAGAEAPIQLVTLDPEGQPQEFHGGRINQDLNLAPGREFQGSDAGGSNPDWLAQEVGRHARGAQRILIDLPTASGSTTRRVLRMSPTILVPVSPDMNSVVSVGAIEAFFRNSASMAAVGTGKPILPFYVLNQFDHSLPLHLDVREILLDQIGDRLLPFALRRSAAVSEALAEGMTVMDYAPNAVVAEDFTNLAGWVRSLSAPASQAYRGVRWSER
jgi:cellulose synthase operon protein YhjQ